MRVICVLLLLLSSFSVQAQSSAEAYIARFDSLAIEVSTKYKIPASLVLGLAMHESGACTSNLCRENHNHFGIRGKVKSSKTKSGYTYAYRKFDSDEAAYWYFGEMISKKKYYAGLKGNLDYMKWLKAMKAANYAASSNWVTRVDNMIKRYDLTCYDIQIHEQIATDPPKTDTIPVPAK
jgi:flagellum-specific peptidoglycan hydrolase FlgJ